jgi:hypothetical protein
VDRPSPSIQPAGDADPAAIVSEAADGPADIRRSTPMRQLSLWISRFRRTLLAARMAIDPGQDDDPGGNDDAGLPRSTPDPAARVVLAHDDLLWFKTSQDAEGRITLGLLACSPTSIGVLVDDNGESLGLRLSRAEAQDLHRSLVTWLAHTGRTVTT